MVLVSLVLLPLLSVLVVRASSSSTRSHSSSPTPPVAGLDIVAAADLVIGEWEGAAGVDYLGGDMPVGVVLHIIEDLREHLGHH